jgi:DNA invertase Pin-like site-specific DNA recombinase
MIVGYSRVSHSSQDHAAQNDALERAGCERLFVETGTGTRIDRPELAKMLEFMRPGDTCFVYRIDRLSRNLRDLLSLLDRFNERQIGLRSLTEAIDSTTPSGKLALHMLAAMSQHEIESLKARTAAGRAAARARGRIGGRPRSLDETKLKIARALMADDQLSMSEIARQVGVAPSTLYRTLPGGRGAFAVPVLAAQAVA